MLPFCEVIVEGWWGVGRLGISLLEAGRIAAEYRYI